LPWRFSGRLSPSDLKRKRVLSTADSPLEIQNQIIDQILDLQAHSSPVCDRDIAAKIGLDLPTLRVHLELLACEDRLELTRDETEYHACILDRQRPQARQSARYDGSFSCGWANLDAPFVSSTTASRYQLMHRRLERLSARLEAIRTVIRRIAVWAPLALGAGGALLGWFCAGPAMRNETTFYMGVFGLIVGIMLRDEFVGFWRRRW
jgi:hypothetical protein